jgi:hypothetical protein
MIARMDEPGVHIAIRRCVVRMLQCVEIPPGLLGKVATQCFRYLSSGDSPVAVKAFSMAVLGRIAEKEPDLGRAAAPAREQWVPLLRRARAERASKGLRGRRDSRLASGAAGAEWSRACRARGNPAPSRHRRAVTDTLLPSRCRERPCGR